MGDYIESLFKPKQEAGSIKADDTADEHGGLLDTYFVSEELRGTWGPNASYFTRRTKERIDSIGQDISQVEAADWLLALLAVDEEISNIEAEIQRHPSGINVLLEAKFSRLYELSDTILELMPGTVDVQTNGEDDEQGIYEHRLEGTFLPNITLNDTGEINNECLDERLVWFYNNQAVLRSQDRLPLDMGVTELQCLNVIEKRSLVDQLQKFSDIYLKELVETHRPLTDFFSPINTESKEGKTGEGIFEGSSRRELRGGDPIFPGDKKHTNKRKKTEESNNYAANDQIEGAARER